MKLFIEDALISVDVMSIFRFIWILITEDTNILQLILSAIISQWTLLKCQVKYKYQGGENKLNNMV